MLRNLAASPALRLTAVADHHAQSLEAACAKYPKLIGRSDAYALIDDPSLGALVIATPASTHFALARAALVAGKHVLVEKPLSVRVEEAEELVALANRLGLVLMVDHTVLFTGAGRHILAMRDAGELGAVTHLDAVRANLGRFLPDVNVLWDLAPHDFALIDALFGDAPTAVEAVGTAQHKPGRHELVHVTLDYPGNRVAHVHLSWVSPDKLRRTVIGSNERVLVWDDLAPSGRLKVYRHGTEPMAALAGLPQLPALKLGACEEPQLAGTEPLAGVIEHFANVIAGKESSIVSGEHGVRVVQLLERAQAALDGAG